MWQGGKGKIERDSIAAQEREGRARKEAREHMRRRYFFPRSFLLRLDPELDRGLGSTSKTKTLPRSAWLKQGLLIDINAILF